MRQSAVLVDDYVLRRNEAEAEIHELGIRTTGCDSIQIECHSRAGLRPWSSTRRLRPFVTTSAEGAIE